MQKILTLNAGSSSIKFSVFNFDNSGLQKEPTIRGQITGLGSTPVLSAIERIDGTEHKTSEPGVVKAGEEVWPFLVGWLEEGLGGVSPAAIAHRVVHGGVKFSAPVVIDEDVIGSLRALEPLAPGHQPDNLAGIETATRKWPNSVQVACFDTAFHRTQPRVEQIFALPRAYADDGIVRYGFHGLSYEYIAQAVPTVLSGYAHEKIIVAHLGSGASMCAMVNGKSVATTMGFTALDGLPMATRCGSLDPGVVLHLIEEKKMPLGDVAECLYKASGLLGISGISGDMRELLASKAPEAAEAIDHFVHCAAKEIGSLTAAMGGLDALIFTAGVGEHSPLIRKRILKKSKWLGFHIDEEANQANRARLTHADSTRSAWMIATNEERMLAQQAYHLFVPSKE